jgi:hypothetical protein
MGEVPPHGEIRHPMGKVATPWVKLPPHGQTRHSWCKIRRWDSRLKPKFWKGHFVRNGDFTIYLEIPTLGVNYEAVTTTGPNRTVFQWNFCQNFGISKDISLWAESWGKSSEGLGNLTTVTVLLWSSPEGLYSFSMKFLPKFRNFKRPIITSRMIKWIQRRSRKFVSSYNSPVIKSGRPIQFSDVIIKRKQVQSEGLGLELVTWLVGRCLARIVMSPSKILPVEGKAFGTGKRHVRQL